MSIFKDAELWLGLFISRINKEDNFMIKLNAKELRKKKPTSRDLDKIERNPIYIILDNVLDTYNIGSIFRLADAVAAKEIILCGETETPPNPRIKKASVNTWKWVRWQYVSTASAAITQLKTQISKLTTIVVEQHNNSISPKELDVIFPVAVVVGNETFGVSQQVVNMADIIIELPMLGVNKSLNVMVSCGIVLYKVVEICRS